MDTNKQDIKIDMDFQYARKSTEDKNRQIASIPDQLGICDRLATQNNAIVSKENIIIDEKTAMKPGKRVGFKLMLDRIFEYTNKSGSCRIFSWKACRLARNSTEGGILVDLVRDGKLKIFTQESGYFNETNFFMLHMEFGYNSKFSKDVSIGVKRNNKFKIDKGICPGHSHLGYMFNPNLLKGLKDHIPNPKNFDKCREWLKLMLTGNYTVEQSLEIMAAKGLVANNGGKVSRSKAYAFFRDIFNVGFFEVKTGPYKGLYQGIHKPLLKMQEYKKIQKIIDSRGGNQKKYDNPLPFMGIIKCGSCDGTITGERHLRIYKNGNEQWFLHSRCTKKLGPCPERYLNATKMDGQVLSYVDEMYMDKKYLELLKEVLKRNSQAKTQRIAKDKELQTKKLIELSKKKELIYGMKDDGLYSEDDYQIKKAEVLKEEQLIKEEFSINQSDYWDHLLDDSMTFIGRVKELYETDDPFIKKQILKILGSNLILEEQKLKVEAKFTFIALKRVQQEMIPENQWLEPMIGLIQQSKLPTFSPSVFSGAGERT